MEGCPINWNSLPVLRGKLLARRSTGEGWEAVWRVDRDSRVFSQLPRGDLWHRESACVRRIRILKRLFRTRASLIQPTYNSADGCNPSFPCISSQDPFPAFLHYSKRDLSIRISHNEMARCLIASGRQEKISPDILQD